MNEEYIKKITTAMILVALIVLAFLLIKPLLMSIIMGMILAVIFYPLYRWINSHLKSPNFSAALICVLLLVLIMVPLWFLIPVIVKQSVRIYIAAQQIDFISFFESLFPELFASETFSLEIGNAISGFVQKILNSFVNSLARIISNFATIFLQSLVVFFTMFFILRDKEHFVSYLESLSPFPKDVEKRLFKSSKDITMSVLYGRILLGIAQGLIVGVGFFIFSVPNALLLTALAALAGVFPIIGTAVIWVPVAIIFLLAGDNLIAFGIILFGIIATVLESIFQPVILAKMVKMNSSIMLIGMIGGIFMFGIMGVILGPLILAYLLIVLEIYRNKRIPGILIEKEKQQ